MKAYFKKKILTFRNPASTSRGVLNSKPSWFIFIEDDEADFKAIGECSIIPGLSIDNLELFETKLKQICVKLEQDKTVHPDLLKGFPAIQFGLETALNDYSVKGTKLLMPSAFTKGESGIPINGLIWMGTEEYVTQQIEQKINQGFRCLKMKIGQEEFQQKFSLLRSLRNRFKRDVLEIRTDANGAFAYNQAVIALQMLAELEVHSVEQPIATKNWDQMADLCSRQILPIALDEELIGVKGELRKHLLTSINPQFIILKPGLLGGIEASKDWLQLAKKYKIGWWVTSALESNIGLNAIAQWTYTESIIVPQGLGTGSLYIENIVSPLIVKKDKLFYDPSKNWDYEFVY